MVRPLAERVQEALGEGYEVTEEMPGGGMSRLFVAQDRTLGRMVVVKLLPEDRLPGLSPDRFQREIRQNDKAFGALERALIRHEPFFTSEPMDSPIFAPIKDEQRLADIRAKVGLISPK